MHARRLQAVALLAIGALGGCAQSYAEGMRVLCATPITAKAQIEAAPTPSAKAVAAAAWIVDHVTNPEVRQLFRNLNLFPYSPREKAAELRKAAARAGLAECPAAALWEAH